MYELRELGAADLAPAWQIESQVFAQDPWPRDLFESELNSPDTYYVGAFAKDTLVGFGGVRGFYEADIMTMAVLPQWQGEGVGTLIVNRLVAEAHERGWDPIFLEVRESNLRARELYLRTGFTELGKVRAYYRKPTEDAVRMGMSRDSQLFR